MFIKDASDSEPELSRYRYLRISAVCFAIQPKGLHYELGCGPGICQLFTGEGGVEQKYGITVHQLRLHIQAPTRSMYDRFLPFANRGP